MLRIGLTLGIERLKSEYKARESAVLLEYKVSISGRSEPR